jgi:malonyl-CoA O-methyltransferase
VSAGTLAVLDKTAVSRSFSAAAGDYDGAAAAQDEIAEGLVARMPTGFSPARVVELGCGTGLLAGRLLRRFPTASLRGLDIASGMIDACRGRFAMEPRARFDIADAEDPEAIEGPVDLVAASCSVQWFNDLGATLQRWRRALAPGGLIAAALLVRGSYPELDAAHQAASGAPFPGLSFVPEEEVPAILTRAELVPISLNSGCIAVRYHSDRDALASFRAIGAVLSGHRGRGALGAGEVRHMLAAYERFCGAGGARVSHRVVWVVARGA